MSRVTYREPAWTPAERGLAVFLLLLFAGLLYLGFQLREPRTPRAVRRTVTVAGCRALDGVPVTADDGERVCITTAALVADSGEAR